MSAVLDTTPVLIGQGQFTYRGPADEAPSPLGLLMRATEAARSRRSRKAARRTKRVCELTTVLSE